MKYSSDSDDVTSSTVKLVQIIETVAAACNKFTFEIWKEKIHKASYI